MSDVVVIPYRFRGPVTSGNGGYSCGVVARELGDLAEVTLRRPPPLDTPLEVEHADDRSIRVTHDGELVAEASSGTVGLDPPEFVALDDAMAAAERSWIALHPEEHPFPACFTCGPGREHPDGLRVFVGPVPGRNVAAASWIPHESLPTSAGRVAPEIVSAVLDCAGGIGSGYVDGHRDLLEPHVLGRFAAELRNAPKIGDPCVALGWRIGRDGRKLFAGSALYAGDGELLALARATWIQLPH